MVSSTNWIRRQIANGLVLLLIAPLAQAAPAARQQAQSGTPSQTAQPSGNPNSGQPRTAPAQQQPAAAQPSPAQPSPAQPQATPQQTNTTQPPNAPEPRQTEPVGTAAAPYENPVGAAVSRPAGAAIAPAKQKRRRSFLIRMGLVIGAAVAVGTVVALSKASPSRPSH